VRRGLIHLALALIGLCLATLALVAPAAGAPAQPLVADITITGMEITQGIQRISSSASESASADIPLVKDRQTRVRVYVKTNNADVAGVKARLRAYRNGSQLPDSPRAAGKNITARINGGNRLNIDESFWFYVPASWRSGTVEFRVEVNYDQSVPESSYLNNTFSRTVTFRQSSDLNLMMVPLGLYNNGNDNNPVKVYRTSNSSFNRLINNIFRFHPVSRIYIWERSGTLWPIIGDWDLRTKDDRSDVLNRIAFSNAMTSDPAGNMHWMGMVHPDIATDGKLGLGQRPGQNAWAKMVNSNDGWPDWYITGGNSISHELGHNKGLKHMPCDGDESSGGEVDNNYPWPAPNCSLAAVSATGYYGTDVYFSAWNLAQPTILSNDPAAPSQNRAFPLLGYKRARWISPYEYCKLLPAYGISCGVTFTSKQSTQEKREAAVLQDPEAFAPRRRSPP
jgi:hypothetical protein